MLEEENKEADKWRDKRCLIRSKGKSERKTKSKRKRKEENGGKIRGRREEDEEEKEMLEKENKKADKGRDKSSLILQYISKWEKIRREMKQRKRGREGNRRE